MRAPLQVGPLPKAHVQQALNFPLLTLIVMVIAIYSIYIV